MSWGMVAWSSQYLLPFSQCGPAAAGLGPEPVEILADNPDASDDSRSLPRLPSPLPPPSPSPSQNPPPPRQCPTNQPAIHQLPTELLFIIAEHLTTFHDLLHLSQSSHRLHRATTPVLHSRAVTHYTLSWAARRGYESLVRTLLDNGVPVESRLNTYSKTAIHYAAAEGRESIVKLLLDRGADINSQGAAKQTALHLAALNGCVDVVKVLLERGADVALRDSMGHTPLLLAVRYSGKVDAVARLLLEGKRCGECVEARESCGGGTALYWAAIKGSEETVRLLLEY